MNFNVRIAVEQCLIAILEEFSGDTLKCLYLVCMDKFGIGSQLRADGFHAWFYRSDPRWKYHEASMALLGRLHTEIQEQYSTNPGFFRFDELFSIVLDDINMDGLHLLQGRAIWLAGQFSDILPENHLENAVLGAVNVLTHFRDARLIFAIKSIKQFFVLVPEKVISCPSLIIPPLCKLVPNASEEYLFLLLETLTLVVKPNPEQTAHFEHLLGPLILNMWKVADGFFNINC
jgi:hypothetical protein